MQRLVALICPCMVPGEANALIGATWTSLDACQLSCHPTSNAFVRETRGLDLLWGSKRLGRRRHAGASLPFMQGNDGLVVGTST